jgi:CO/xanthine dehydrogenase FAD-binding subunit
MVREYHPTRLQDALELRAAETVVPYAGGTDLMIAADKNARYLFLDRIAELKTISEDADTVRIGAACTFTELLESGLIPAFLKEVVLSIAAPAIRNMGTVGGNICNGSAKADSALALVAADSVLRLVSVRGERIIPISEFYLGGKKTALLPDELLIEILMNKAGTGQYYYRKIGARNALAISRVSFAALYDVKDDRITVLRTAFGAIGDVILTRPDIDSMLLGKTRIEARAVKAEYLKAYDKAIVPIKGRVSAEYRKSVCMNLLRDFLETRGI